MKIYHAQAAYRPALNYCLQSIAIAKQHKNRFQALSYRALFTIYHNLRMNDSEVKYGVYSLRLTEEIKDTVNIATNYGNLTAASLCVRLLQAHLLHWSATCSLVQSIMQQV